MKATCKMSNTRTTWPCPARACPLFGDCIVEYQRKKAIMDHLGKAIRDFCYRTGHYPAAILAEPVAYLELRSYDECAYRDENGELRWGNSGIPLREFCSGALGVYLIDRLDPVLTLPKENA